VFHHGRVHSLCVPLYAPKRICVKRYAQQSGAPPSRSVRSVGQKVDIDDLVDAVEIAHRTGVGRPQVVHDWRRRHAAFPKPVARYGNAHVWLWPDVESWALSTGRLERDNSTK
jgi:predicted DNA-binding transcriptional regulator AlpA